jgi:hypothetical protein
MHAIGYSRSKPVTAIHVNPKTGHNFYSRGNRGGEAVTFLIFSARSILPPILYY